MTRGLVEKYWDALYPDLDPAGEGVSARVSQFGGLFQARRHPALHVPLTDGEKYTELDYEQALSFDKVADPKEKQARIAKGEVTMEKFKEAVRETSTPMLKALAEDIEECLVEGEKLIAVLKPKCGKNGRGEDVAPSAREFAEVLKRVFGVVKLVAGDRIAVKAAVAAADGDAPKASGGGPAQAARPKEPTPETAISQLRELAEFFRRTEPHSPISHHLEEAVRWGQMALPDLLSELVPDEKTRKELFTSHWHRHAGEEIAGKAPLVSAGPAQRGCGACNTKSSCRVYQNPDQEGHRLCRIFPSSAYCRKYGLPECESAMMCISGMPP